MKLPLDLLKRKESAKPESGRVKSRKGMSISQVGWLVFLVVCIVLFLAAALIYWVGASEVEQVRTKRGVLVAESMAKRVAGFLQLQINTMEVLAKDPSLTTTMEETPQEEWQATAVELGKRFPEAIRIRLLPQGLTEIDMDAVPPISYSVLEELRLAETGTPPPAEAHLVGAPRQHVNLVRRIDSVNDGRVLGTLVASFGLPVLEHLVSGENTGGGYLELQQPAPNGKPLVLAVAGDPTLKSGLPVSQLPKVPGSRWQLKYWEGYQSGRLSSRGETVIVITLAVALGALAILLYLLFRWLSVVIDRDQSILIAMLEDLHEGKRSKHPTVQLAANRATMELIRDIEQTGVETRVQTAGDSETAVPAELEADPLIDSIEPDGGMFGVQEVSIDPTIFRKYDIRGIVETSLTPEVVYEIGCAIGSEAQERNEPAVIIGRDGRLSGPDLVDAVTQGLRASGCSVIDIGAVPTPLVYFATNTLNSNSGVMITGSHNPPEYNGIKIVIAGQTLAEDAIQALYQRILDGNLKTGSGGQETADVVPDYIQRIISDVEVKNPKKVIIDCGNGIAGAVAPQLIRALGCEVMELYCEVDGTFPNHHPDPGKPENLTDLIQAVQQQQADIGLAFDGDGDRLGVVASDGSIIWPDRLLMLFAMDVLNRNSGAQIIYDVKCTRHLATVIKDFGGKPLMWKTGHSLIKAKMKETDALLAGEMSGHIFFKERWFGFDDALYSAARLLEILSNNSRSSSDVFSALPDSVNTPEINIPMEEGEPAEFVRRLLEVARFEDADVVTIDGLRVDFQDGWGLVRASNTTPCLVLRFEADNPEALSRIQDQFREAMLAVRPDMSLPF